MSNVIYTTEAGQKFRCTQAQVDAIEQLKSIVKGGIGTVHKYVSTSGRVTPQVADIQFITGFSVSRLYERKIVALNGIGYDDVKDKAERHDRVQQLTEAERIDLFNTRKNGMIASMQKTLDGDRSDNRRQAHDRMFCTVAKGVKVHFHGYDEEYINEEGNKAKRRMPELIAGLPVAKSINLNILAINKTIIEEGEYRKVNSKAPTLMSNAIESSLNSRSVSMRSLSLQADNFESLVLSRKTFSPDDFEAIPSDLFLMG